MTRAQLIWHLVCILFMPFTFMMARPTSIGRKVQSRIKASVLRTEGSALDPDRRQPNRGTMWNPGVVDAVVTQAITNSIGTAYGFGKAQIYIDVTNTTAGTTDLAYPDPVDVLNWSANSGTISIGVHIGIYWRNGRWRLAWNDC